LYTIIDNHPLIPEWCDDVVRMCPAVPADCPSCNLTADERFDLDRSGDSFKAPDFDPTAAEPDVLGDDLRKNFSWQWYLVMAFDEIDKWTWSFGTGRVFEKKGSLNKGEGITLSPSSCSSSCKKSRNVAVDVDGDFKMEQVAQDTIKSASSGVIASFGVIDAQEGDLDFSTEPTKEKPAPGFQRDAQIYASVRGTYFLVEEGRLFDPNGKQFIRTTRKRDQIDLVERVFKLSNDTDFFCDKDGNPTINGEPVGIYGAYVSDAVNRGTTPRAMPPSKPGKSK